MAIWYGKFYLKDLLSEDDSDEEAQRVGKIVAERLRAYVVSERFKNRQPLFGGKTEEFAQRFENVLDSEEFNDALSDLYDLADDVKVWIE